MDSPEQKVKPSTWKKIIDAILIGITATTLTLFTLYWVVKISAPFIIRGVFQSHIDANIPDKNNIDFLLTRDLQSYFQKKYGDNVSVKYENLDGPFSGGVGFPKYFVQVKVFKNNVLIEEGGIELAAVEKDEFRVYGWYPETK